MRRVIDRFGAWAAREPVVENRVQDSDEGCQLPGIHHVILATVFVGKQSTNWLLAVNRVRPSETEDCQSSHDEFGSVEAGMMSTVASILATHTRNHELFHEKEDLFLAAVRSLVSAIDAKDAYTCGHSERVALFSRRLGEEFGLDVAVCHQLYLGGLLHDVGKIGVQDATLSKRGRLTEEEFSEIKKHPVRGWEILVELENLTYVWPAVVHHHEHFDGSGYPDALAGDEIPLVARILAVADTYDALTSDRPYRQGMTQERAEAILREGAGTQWDPVVVDAMFQAMPDMIRIRREYQPHQPAERPRVRVSGTENSAPASAGTRGGGGLIAENNDLSRARSQAAAR
ncbi:MAG: HD-GYP domain-containing protein [Planctomycetes bacterium]|nr:HD-GYP domain-containing protein [Planctomycetota bacterium]